MSKYVVVDLEMCKVPKGIKREEFGCGYELIEIGAVLMDESLEIAGSFKTYVSPEFGSIDTYIENLTGISAAHTKDAPTAKEALEMFAAWLPEDAVLVSWSENDERQIRKELKGKNICIPKLDKYLDNWIDCQKTFGEKMNCRKNYKLSEALCIADIYFEDGAHDALVDAHNTALLFAKMQREPRLQLAAGFIPADSVETYTYNPFVKLLAGYRCAVL
ncbi:MAG: exonuclease domain-containing protein [Clostridia bacterium]|nr:exonuclease domain-containing protein [Clostridia bacterium]